MSTPAVFVPAVNHGGRMPGPPALLVVHDAETPLERGYALSLARNWFGRPQPAGRESSAHYMVDPGQIVQMVHTYDIAWHVGARANSATLGYEQAGYARFSRAQWTTADGLSQLRLLAAKTAEDLMFYKLPQRWATDQQIRDAITARKPGGMCRHMDITRVIGGTTHTDPGDNYPRDLLLAAVQKAALVKPPTPTPPPAVTFTDIAGRLPILRAGMRDPIAGLWYVSRVQMMLRVPVTGAYDAATVHAVAAFNARVLNRRAAGEQVDGTTWHRLYALR